MAKNGISTLPTKQAKQVAKLALAQLKRQGYTLNADGTIAGGPDVTASFFRARNNYVITELPTQYIGNTVVSNDNGSNLIQGRPWSSVPIPSVGTLDFSDPLNSGYYFAIGSSVT